MEYRGTLNWLSGLFHLFYQHMVYTGFFEGKCRTMQDNAVFFWLFAGHLQPKMKDNAGQFWKKREKCRTMQDTNSAVKCETLRSGPGTGYTKHIYQTGSSFVFFTLTYPSNFPILLFLIWFFLLKISTAHVVFMRVKLTSSIMEKKRIILEYSSNLSVHFEWFHMI